MRYERIRFMEYVTKKILRTIKLNEKVVTDVNISASILSKFDDLSSTISETYLSVSEANDKFDDLSSTISETYLSVSEADKKVDKITDVSKLELEKYTIGEYLSMLARQLSGGTI